METLFDQYKELNINGSLICLEQVEDIYSYFCYPTNAKAIGFEGSIMYCFIEPYGEMVFACNPDTCADVFVYPLARTFEDFMRLILACGSTNPIEQIIWMDKDKFEKHLKEEEAIRTEEQKATLSYLETELEISPIDNPYDYVKEEFNTECITVIDQRFAIAYVKKNGRTSIYGQNYPYNTIPRCFGLMDTQMLEDVGVAQVRRSTLDLYGNGVLVGMIDTGIDYEHPAFRYEDGSSKIYSLWDQTIEGDPEDTFLGYGTEYTKEQIEEEKLKAKLIVANPDNKSVIFNTEDTDLLQGKISFALYCIDYEAGMALDIKRLESVKNVISTYFKDDKDINNDLRRALLTIADDDGNYYYYGYWWSFWNVVNANKRSLIDSNLRSLEFYIYGRFSEEYKIYIKKLILKLMNNNLQEIVTNFTPPNDMPNWKIRLIKEPKLLDEMCKSNHIAIPEDDSCCYLLKSMRPRDINGCYKIV